MMLASDDMGMENGVGVESGVVMENGVESGVGAVGVETGVGAVGVETGVGAVGVESGSPQPPPPPRAKLPFGYFFNQRNADGVVRGKKVTVTSYRPARIRVADRIMAENLNKPRPVKELRLDNKNFLMESSESEEDITEEYFLRQSQQENVSNAPAVAVAAQQGDTGRGVLDNGISDDAAGRNCGTARLPDGRGDDDTTFRAAAAKLKLKKNKKSSKEVYLHFIPGSRGAENVDDLVNFIEGDEKTSVEKKSGKKDGGGHKKKTKKALVKSPSSGGSRSRSSSPDRPTSKRLKKGQKKSDKKVEVESAPQIQITSSGDTAQPSQSSQPKPSDVAPAATPTKKMKNKNKVRPLHTPSAKIVKVPEPKEVVNAPTPRLPPSAKIAKVPEPKEVVNAPTPRLPPSAKIAKVLEPQEVAARPPPSRPSPPRATTMSLWGPVEAPTKTPTQFVMDEASFPSMTITSKTAPPVSLPNYSKHSNARTVRNFPFSTPAKENSTETEVKDCVVVPSKTEPTTVSTASSTRSPLMASTPLSTARGQCQDRGVQSCPSISIGTTPALSLNSEGSEPQIQLPLVISTPPPATAPSVAEPNLVSAQEEVEDESRGSGSAKSGTVSISISMCGSDVFTDPVVFCRGVDANMLNQDQDLNVEFGFDVMEHISASGSDRSEPVAFCDGVTEPETQPNQELGVEFGFHVMENTTYRLPWPPRPQSMQLESTPPPYTVSPCSAIPIFNPPSPTEDDVVINLVTSPELLPSQPQTISQQDLNSAESPLQQQEAVDNPNDEEGAGDSWASQCPPPPISWAPEETYQAPTSRYYVPRSLLGNYRGRGTPTQAQPSRPNPLNPGRSQDNRDRGRGRHRGRYGNKVNQNLQQFNGQQLSQKSKPQNPSTSMTGHQQMSDGDGAPSPPQPSMSAASWNEMISTANAVQYHKQQVGLANHQGPSQVGMMMATAAANHQNFHGNYQRLQHQHYPRFPVQNMQPHPYPYYQPMIGPGTWGGMPRHMYPYQHQQQFPVVPVSSGCEENMELSQQPAPIASGSTNMTTPMPLTMPQSHYVPMMHQPSYIPITMDMTGSGGGAVPPPPGAGAPPETPTESNLPIPPVPAPRPYIGQAEYDENGEIVMPPGVEHPYLYYSPPNFPIPTQGSEIAEWMNAYSNHVYQLEAEGKITIYRV